MCCLEKPAFPISRRRVEMRQCSLWRGIRSWRLLVWGRKAPPRRVSRVLRALAKNERGDWGCLQPKSSLDRCWVCDHETSYGVGLVLHFINLIHETSTCHDIKCVLFIVSSWLNRHWFNPPARCKSTEYQIRSPSQYWKREPYSFSLQYCFWIIPPRLPMEWFAIQWTAIGMNFIDEAFQIYHQKPRMFWGSWNFPLHDFNDKPYMRFHSVIAAIISSAATWSGLNSRRGWIPSKLDTTMILVLNTLWW